MSQLPTIISGPESADADTQDGKDGGEKEAETYENVFEYLTKGCYPQGASKAEKSVLRRIFILFYLFFILFFIYETLCNLCNGYNK